MFCCSPDEACAKWSIETMLGITSLPIVLVLNCKLIMRKVPTLRGFILLHAPEARREASGCLVVASGRWFTVKTSCGLIVGVSGTRRL